MSDLPLKVKKQPKIPIIWQHKQYVTKDKEGDYVGISVNKDHLFTMSGYLTAHNSTAIDIVGIIYWWLLHPEDRIAIVRKSYMDACSIVKSVAQAMDNEYIRCLFYTVQGIDPRPTTRKEGVLQYNFKRSITPEPSLKAHGLDGSLTGFHYDKIICDDIITLKDRVSQAEREKTNEVIRELVTNIIDPGKGSLWIGTPWHKDDGWNVINSFADIAKYPASKYWFLGKEALEDKRAATTPFLFAANYELEILNDENALFQNPKFFAGWNYTKRCVAHVDAAFDGDHYCAFTILQPKKEFEMSKATELRAIGHVYAGNIKDWMPNIVQWCRQFHVLYLYMEDNADKGFAADKLREQGVRCRTYHETQNKHAKIATNAYLWWQKTEWHTSTDDEYINQFLDYHEGEEPDDAPDSMASLIRETMSQKVTKYRSLYE